MQRLDTTFGRTDHFFLRGVIREPQSKAEPVTGGYCPGLEVRRMATRKIGRDAKTGEFIPVKEAKQRPNTTVVETIKVSKPKPK